MKVLLSSFILMAFQALGSDIKVSDISFNKISSSKGKVVLKFNQEIKDAPELTLKERMIQLAIPNVIVWPKIQKQIKVSSNGYDGKMLAYQFDKDLVRFRLHLPYSPQKFSDRISVNLKERRIEVVFPIEAKKVVKQNTKEIIKRDIGKKEYDESYLQKLLADKKPAKVNEKTFLDEPSKDEVKLKKSSLLKKKESGFSIMNYAGKFFGFLGLMLVMFYGIVTIFKKGVSKRGKLGFLNKQQLIEVLSTTYIAPKRTLMVVRVHDQVLLLGNSENGISMISEIKNTAAFIKNAEEIVSGSNFDTEVNGSSETNKDFKVKEDINVSSDGALSDFLAQTKKDIPAKLSDKIKTKVKGLKSLQ